MHARRVLATNLISVALEQTNSRTAIVSMLVKEVNVPYEVAETYLDIFTRLEQNTVNKVSNDVRDRAIKRLQEINGRSHIRPVKVKKPRKKKAVSNQINMFEPT